MVPLLKDGNRFRSPDENYTRGPGVTSVCGGHLLISTHVKWSLHNAGFVGLGLSPRCRLLWPHLDRNATCARCSSVNGSHSFKLATISQADMQWNCRLTRHVPRCSDRPMMDRTLWHQIAIGQCTYVQGIQTCSNKPDLS